MHLIYIVIQSPADSDLGFSFQKIILYIQEMSISFRSIINAFCLLTCIMIRDF